jgi:hypothetical protein
VTRRHSILLGGVIVALSLAGLARQPNASADAAKLPSSLSDRQFWKIIGDFSEPNGFFRSDNLLSNEIFLQHVIPDLIHTARTERAYIGVGPEQNFTYIAALRPKIAFILDIRRANLQLHLMYKALFEMSADRAEFVSRLFSKKRPAGLGAHSTAHDIFAAYAKVDTSELAYRENLLAIQTHLVRKRRLPLTADDLKGIEYVYYAFYWHGPVIQYWSSGGGGRGARDAPTYADLMLAEDGKGAARSYMAREDSFAFVRDLHARNLIVPIVGNFAGPKALRAIARYLKERDATVSAFYLSNVEQYLSREGQWYAFCGNVATLPLDSSSTFIRSVRNGMYGRGVGLDSILGNMAAEVKRCITR